MFFRLTALLVALSGLLLAPSALACSSTTAYVAPSNFELVQMAEAIGIYVAEPLPQTGSGPTNPDDPGLGGFGDPMIFRGATTTAPPSRSSRIFFNNAGRIRSVSGRTRTR